MIRLGLLGKNIAHSKSQDLYTELLNQEIFYKKYDIENPGDIPSLESIFSEVQGLSITSPYKKHFFNEVEMTEEVADLGGINCIKKTKSGFEATNTDYLALLDIIKEFKLEFEKEEMGIKLMILGDGTMSKVTQAVANKLGVTFSVFSRKHTPDFENLTLSSDERTNGNPLKLIHINACSREFVFSGTIKSGIIFLDYNYNFEPHLKLFSTSDVRYVDGIDLLKRQAQYALEFWKISD